MPHSARRKTRFGFYGDKTRSTLPSIPLEAVRDTHNQQRLEQSTELLQKIQSEGLEAPPIPTGDKLTDALTKLEFLNKRPQYNAQSINETLKEVSAASPNTNEEGGFLSGLLSTLEKVALPFEAFSEGVNALIGPLVPQDAFRERSGRSREILADLFGGDISGADAAGLLREVHRERSTVEQIVTGFFFDPINVIFPGASAMRAGVRGGVMAGTRAGGRSLVDTALPFVGPKIRRRLTLRDAVDAIDEQAGVTTNPVHASVQQGPWERLDYMGRMPRAGFRRVAGAANGDAVPPGKGGRKPEGEEAAYTTEEQFLKQEADFEKIRDAEVDVDAIIRASRQVLKVVLETEEGREKIPTASLDLPERLAEAIRLGEPIRLSGAWKEMLDVIEAQGNIADAAHRAAGLPGVPQDGTMIRLMRATAGREFEIANMLVDDIDFTNGRVYFLEKGVRKGDAIARAKGRQSVYIGDGLLKELYALADGKKPGDYLFQNPRARTGGRGFSSKMLNTRLRELAEAGGITREGFRGLDIRAASISFWAEQFAEAGIDIRAAAVLAGWSPNSLKAVKAAYQAFNLVDETTGRIKIPELDYLENFLNFEDGAFNPLPRTDVSPIITPLPITLAHERLIKAKEAGDIVLPFTGDTVRRKGKTGFDRLGKEAVRSIEGRRIYYALPAWADTSFLAQAREVLSQAEIDLMTDVFRMQNGASFLREAKIADNFLDSLQTLAGRNSAKAKEWGKLRTALTKEMNNLAAGMTESLFNHPKRAGFEGISGLKSVYLEKLRGAGLINANELRLISDGFSDWTGLALSQLEGSNVRYIREKIGEVFLSTLNLDWQYVEKNGISLLSKVETETFVASRTSAERWFNWPQMHTILGRLGFRVERGEVREWQIVGSKEKLYQQLSVLAVTSARARHLLGNDFHKTAARGGASNDIRMQRVGRLLDDLHELGYITTEASADARARRLGAHAAPARGVTRTEQVVGDVAGDGVGGGRGGRDQGPGGGFTPEDPLRPLEGESEPEFIERMLGVSRDMEYAVYFSTKPNSVLAKIDEWARNLEVAPIGTRNRAAQLSAGFTRKMLTAITMKGASARDMGRVGLARAGEILHVQQQSKLAKMMFLEMPGWKSIYTRFVDLDYKPNVGTPSYVRDSWNEAAGLPSTVDAAKIADHPETTTRKVMEHVRTIFDPEIIDNAALEKYYNFTGEELRVIKLTRKWVAGATNRVSKKGFSVKEFLGQFFKGDEFYFPYRPAESKLRDATLANFGEKGTWSFNRPIEDAVTAIAQRKEYLNPLDAAADYVIDIQRFAIDSQAIEMLKKMVDVTTTIRHMQDTFRYSRTLKNIAERVASEGGANLSEGQKSFFRAMSDQEDVGRFEVWRDIGDTFKEVMKGKEQAAAQLDHINEIMNRAQGEFIEARKFGQKAEKAGAVGLKGMAFMNPADNKRALDFFTQGEGRMLEFARSVNTWSAFFRFMQAGFDLSALFIHGMLAAFTHPKEWAVGSRKMFGALFSAEGFRVYMQNPKRMASAQDFSQHGGIIGISELAEAAETTGRLFKEHIPGPLGRRLQGASERFERSFRAWQDVTRIELWETLGPMIRGNAKFTDEMKEMELQKLARFVNGMTGVYNPQLAGLSQLQRYMEGSFISFAPMYRRASFGLITQAMSGGLPQSEVYKSLGKLATVGLLFGFIGDRMGNKQSDDPTSPQFLALPIGDHYIGIGTAFYSLARLIGNTTEQVLHPDAPKNLTSLSVDDNVFLRWWRSQSPPLMSGMMDLITGETYIGQPLRGDDGDFSMTLIRNWGWRQFTPIGLENMFTELRSPGDLAIFGEGMGLRTFPESPYRERYRLRNFHLEEDTDPEIMAWRRAQAAEGKPVTFDKLPVLLKQRIDDKYPDLLDVTARVEEDTELRGTTLQRRIQRYMQTLDDNRDTINEMRLGSYNAFASGTIDSRTFREQLSELNVAQRQLSEGLNRDDSLKGVQEHFEEKKLNRTVDTQFEGDFFYDKYIRDVVLNERHTDENGQFLFEEWRKSDFAFFKDVGAEIYNYIMERRETRKQLPAPIEEFEDAKDALKPYWKLAESIWGVGSEELYLINELNRKPARDQAEWRRKNPRVKRLERRLRLVQERYRRANPNLDWLLVKWYDASARTSYAENQLAAWRQSQINTGFRG